MNVSYDSRSKFTHDVDCIDNISNKLCANRKYEWNSQEAKNKVCITFHNELLHTEVNVIYTLNVCLNWLVHYFGSD